MSLAAVDHPSTNLGLQKKEAKADEPITSPGVTQGSATPESPVAATSEGKPGLKERRRTSIFNSLGTKKEKSEAEVTDGETKKSPLPQKLGGLFRKPSKAVRSEENQTQPTATATPVAPITESTKGEAPPPAKGETALTNGTSEVPKEPVTQVPETVTGPGPEVKASA